MMWYRQRIEHIEKSSMRADPKALDKSSQEMNTFVLDLLHCIEDFRTIVCSWIPVIPGRNTLGMPIL